MKKQKVQQHMIRKFIARSLVITISSFVVLLLGATSATVSAASCASEPSTKTGRIVQTVTIPQDGAYTIWSRLSTPSSQPVSYVLYTNGNCITVGQSALTPNAFTWVDYQDGVTTNKINLTLTAGQHQIVLTARTQLLEVDRVLFIADGCTPTGTGDNCIVASSTTSPSTSSSPNAENSANAAAQGGSYLAKTGGNTIQMIYAGIAIIMLGSAVLLLRYRRGARRFSSTLFVIGGIVALMPATTVFASTSPPSIEPDLAGAIEGGRLLTRAGASQGKVFQFNLPQVCGVAGYQGDSSALPEFKDMYPAKWWSDFSFGDILNATGATYENFSLPTEVFVESDDVTLQNFYVSPGSGYYPVRTDARNPGANLTIKNATIAASGATDNSLLKGIVMHDNTHIQNVHISGVHDGIAAGTDGLIENTCIDNLALTPNSHNDGIEIYGGENITIRNSEINNTIPQTAAVNITNEYGSVNEVLIEDTVLSGGGYTIYVRGDGSSGAPVTNIRFRNVTVSSPGQYGVISYQGAPGAIVEWDVKDANGNPIPAP